MKKRINDPGRVVEEAVEGLVAIHPSRPAAAGRGVSSNGTGNRRNGFRAI